MVILDRVIVIFSTADNGFNSRNPRLSLVTRFQYITQFVSSSIKFDRVRKDESLDEPEVSYHFLDDYDVADCRGSKLEISRWITTGSIIRQSAGSSSIFSRSGIGQIRDQLLKRDFFHETGDALSRHILSHTV